MVKKPEQVQTVVKKTWTGTHYDKKKPEQVPTHYGK